MEEEESKEGEEKKNDGNNHKRGTKIQPPYFNTPGC